MTETGPDKRTFLLLALVVLALALAPRLYQLHKVGIHVDEPDLVMVGDTHLMNLLRWDLDNDTWSVGFEHPPVARWLYGLAFQLQKTGWRIFSWYLAPKGVGVLLGVGSVLLTMIVGRRLYGGWIGLWAGAILALTPHVIGHNRIAGLEGPSLFFWLLCWWICLRALEPGAGKGWMIWLGIAFGLCVGVRYNNGLVLFAIAATALLAKLKPTGEFKWSGWSWQALAWPAVALAFLIVIWPWLWPNPIFRLLESSIWQGTRINHEWFLGVKRPLPWFYYLTYLAVTTPPLFLVGAGLFPFRWAAKRTMADWQTLIWLAAPLLMSLLAFKQDGVRYVFPVYGALALAGAAGLSWLGGGLARLFGLAAGKGRAVLAGLGLVCGTWAVVSFWPYQIDYYNFLAGSPETMRTEGRYRFGWWGEGIQPALAFLNKTAPAGAKVAFGTPHFMWRLQPVRPDFKVVEPDKADYLMTWNPDWVEVPEFGPDKWQVVFEEKFKGTVFARVFKRKRD